MSIEDEIEDAAEAEGRAAALSGLPESACPYKPSGHERDTTFDDYRYMGWQRGYDDAIVPATPEQ
jgi:hypothetical protein